MNLPLQTLSQACGYVASVPILELDIITYHLITTLHFQHVGSVNITGYSDIVLVRTFLLVSWFLLDHSMWLWAPTDFVSK
jgi:hypothetical protein